jgi:hypothetical protein
MGETSFQRSISAVTQAKPCVITTDTDHDYQTNQVVRVTDLGSEVPTYRGMDSIDGRRFRITVIDTTSFSLQDPITNEDIDTTQDTAYVEGGNVNLETRVMQLNVPQVYPYSKTNRYVANPFFYEA